MTLPWNRGRRGTKRSRGSTRGRPKFWTDAHILQALRALASELGHSPSARECDASEDAPSNMLIRLRFGTYNAAILAAGLAPKKAGGQPCYHAKPEKSNHKWVLATVDPEKAREITAAKAAHWGIRVESLPNAVRPKAPAVPRSA